jgi:hypothetical protein
MDSFSEPYTRLGDDVSLEEVRAQVRAIENEHRAQNVALSGRILHVCHYLPITAHLASRAGVISPPATPPTKATEVSLTPISDGEASPTAETAAETVSTPTWLLTLRYGHDAMISGIRSLVATHDQVIVGWTGDIYSTTPGERIPTASISEADSAALEDALRKFQPREADPDDSKKVTYCPVWLEDKVAHGHYDGYCKQSECMRSCGAVSIFSSLSTITIVSLNISFCVFEFLRPFRSSAISFFMASFLAMLASERGFVCMCVTMHAYARTFLRIALESVACHICIGFRSPARPGPLWD